jgi:hypothetical protein
MVSQITASRDLSESSCGVFLFISSGDVPPYMAETHMLQAVGRPPLRNRRGAIAKLRRARLADGVAAVLAELRQHRRLHPRRLYWPQVGLGRGLIVLDRVGGLHLCTW